MILKAALKEAVSSFLIYRKECLFLDEALSLHQRQCLFLWHFRFLLLSTGRYVFIKWEKTPGLYHTYHPDAFYRLQHPTLPALYLQKFISIADWQLKTNLFLSLFFSFLLLLGLLDLQESRKQNIQEKEEERRESMGGVKQTEGTATWLGLLSNLQIVSSPGISFFFIYQMPPCLPSHILFLS